jgi:hypothetical protein
VNGRRTDTRLLQEREGAILFGLARPLSQGFNIGPEFLPPFPFRVWQFRQDRLVAHAGQCGVGLPALVELLRRCMTLGLPGLSQLFPQVQFGPQPAERLPAQSSPLLVIRLKLAQLPQFQG